MKDRQRVLNAQEIITSMRLAADESAAPFSNARAWLLNGADCIADLERHLAERDAALLRARAALEAIKEEYGHFAVIKDARVYRVLEIARAALADAASPAETCGEKHHDYAFVFCKLPKGHTNSLHGALGDVYRPTRTQREARS